MLQHDPRGAHRCVGGQISLPFLLWKVHVNPISAGEMFIVPKVVEHKTQLIGLFGGAVTSLLAALRVLINLYSSQNDPACHDQ